MLKFYTYKLEESSEMAGRCLDAELMHKWLCRLTGSSRQESGLLYMLDTKYMLLHVQSQVPLQTPELQEVGSLDLDTFFSRLHDGDRVSFLLTTLPHKKKNGHISYIVDPYGEKAWVKKRLAEHGFDATSVVPMEKKEVYFRHDKQKRAEMEELPCGPTSLPDRFLTMSAFLMYGKPGLDGIRHTGTDCLSNWEMQHEAGKSERKCHINGS